MKFIAKTFYGLEPILADELKQIGAEQIEQVNRAVTFEGDLKTLYRANLELRTALKILKPIYSFNVKDEGMLYKNVRDVDWSEHMFVDDTLSIYSVVNSPFFNHANYVSLKTKDAIVDQFRDKYGRRPNVDSDNPTLGIQVHISNDNCTLLLDSSGQSLHRRGYRQEALEAPLKEVLAAGMLLSSGWPNGKHFFDPMCGSGTIAIEAALIANNIPSQWRRKVFGFQKWRDYDLKLWRTVRKEAKSREIKSGVKIYGCDLDLNAIKIARENTRNAGLQEKIRFSTGDFFDSDPPFEDGMMVSNPPYDERLKVKDIGAFYASIGDTLKQKYAGWEAWFISSNFEAIKQIGLKASKKTVLYNGPLETKFLKFEMFKGSNKDFKTNRAN